jgi:hypothetical protein
MTYSFVSIFVFIRILLIQKEGMFHQEHESFLNYKFHDRDNLAISPLSNIGIILDDHGKVGRQIIVNFIFDASSRKNLHL